jgi:Nif-specific regulatory protein
VIIIKQGAWMAYLKKVLADIEQEAIRNAMRECGWVMAKAARRLGITERMIGYKIKKYGIEREVKKTDKKRLCAD